MCLSHDRGSKFYVDQCPSCKQWSDHEKIEIKPAHDVNEVLHKFEIEEKKVKDEDRGEGEK